MSDRFLGALIFVAVVVLSCSIAGRAACGPPAAAPSNPKSSLLQEAAKYEELIRQIAEKQQHFQKTYASSGAARQRELVREAQSYLTSTISRSLFPSWYGTPWNFNGTTRVPKQGAIACGYFVTGILSDAGFRIPRVKWAQSASQVMITRTASNIERFSSQPMGKLIDYLNNQGDGLYVVGLDNHVGFISKSGTTYRFVHAS
ncbi:MAG: hypothetical protein FWD68_16335 [Alphaproteobacteria bacterium]|nr:hypothetical protein [Alphaproteobacteria bacterium]